MLDAWRNDMGYRSSGKWIIKGPADAMTAAWAELRLNPPAYNSPPNISLPPPSFNDFDFYVVGDTGYIRFEFKNWKWYPDYSDIRWYESVWTRLSENERLSGHRIRVGEDNAIEEDWFGNDIVYINANVIIEDDEPQPPTTTE